jgi:predicted ABC-type exoprotein transport system permease subunit
MRNVSFSGRLENSAAKKREKRSLRLDVYLDGVHCMSWKITTLIAFILCIVCLPIWSYSGIQGAYLSMFFAFAAVLLFLVGFLRKAWQRPLER